MRETALRYLNRNYLLHVDMIEGICRELYDIIYAGEDGVLLALKGDSGALLSCNSAQTALRLLEKESYELIGIHQPEYSSIICRERGYTPWMTCWQAAYTKKEKLPEVPCDIHLLDSRYLNYICQMYTSESPEYIKERLEAGVVYGIFEGGKLAGFIGQHAEGAIGLLQVLPEYRRRGYAQALESRYINLELANRYVPYGQVVVGNMASRQLQEKLGMDFADGCVCWLWKE